MNLEGLVYALEKPSEAQGSGDKTHEREGIPDGLRTVF